MRRIWVSAAAVLASVAVTGWMAASSAEDRKPGAALPPPSLFDDAPNQVRAVGTPEGDPATAVVQAKPASSAQVKAEAGMPPPERFDEEPVRKVVWWKPWTWFSGNARPAARPDDSAEPASAAAPASTPVPAAAATAAADSRQGYAVDSPSQKIRSGTGGCVKTGMWAHGGKTGVCGDSAAEESPLAAAKAGGTGTAPAASAAIPATAAVQPAPAPSAVPVTPAPQPEPVVVSPLAPDQDDQRKPLGEKDTFESVRVNSGDTRASADLSPAAVAAARSGQGAGTGADKSRAAASAGAPDGGMPAKGPSRMVEDKPLSMSAEALFGFKSATLLYGGKKQLDEFARKLTDGDYQSVRIVGHTDRVGTPERNKKLSMRRAKAVKDYLVSKGISATRIAVDGRGATEPVTEARQCDGLPMTARRACMSPDRRVEIVVTRAFAKQKPDAAPVAGAPRS